MIEHGKVRSNIYPQELIIDDFSVWVHSDINDAIDEEFIGYEYKMTQYTKDEFIKLQVEKNTTLENQLIDTQLALVEIYERTVV